MQRSWAMAFVLAVLVCGLLASAGPFLAEAWAQAGGEQDCSGGTGAGSAPCPGDDDPPQCNGVEYDPDTQGCCDGTIYSLDTQGCCAGSTYTLATHGCCHDQVASFQYDCCCSNGVFPAPEEYGCLSEPD